MERKKLNTIITVVIISLIAIVGSIIFFLNYSRDESSLTVLEKKWINDNINKVVDINIYNDIPVYSYNGSGIIFDYLDYFSDEYGVKFNKISSYEEKDLADKELVFLSLNNDTKLNDSDILIYEDNYVILKSNTNDYINKENIDTLGVLKADESIIKKYFNNDNIVYTSYENVTDLINAYKNTEVNYLILPNVRYMDDILKNNLSIVYHINDLKTKYVLRVTNKEAYNVLSKTYKEYYKEEFQTDYSINYLNIYFNNTSTTDLDRKNYNAKTYKYGYVINMPYENYNNKEFVGTISNYLKGFEKATNTEIEVVRYDNIDDLRSALVSDEVDFSLGNFEFDKINMKKFVTSSVSDLNYVILSKDSFVINSLVGLNDKKVSVVNESIIYNLCRDKKIKTINYNNTDELLRSVNDDSIIMIDMETYIYYKDNKLKDYNIIYEDTIHNAYKFIMNENNKTFNKLFNYYINSINYDVYRYNYNTDISLEKDYTTYKVIIFIVALLVFLSSFVLLINRKKVTNTVVSREDKLKFIDPMTSLKNRNYLNTNIYKWDDNVIFPQSVVVFDLNNVREVNDKLGREAGDEIIKKVAGVLINNQLENTDIIRSGGDEFLIYMIGYEEKKVVEYTKNLVKEMKSIPNSLGVECGYSMILDEVKTVDDAINEAIIMMNKNKEKRNK